MQIKACRVAVEDTAADEGGEVKLSVRQDCPDGLHVLDAELCAADLTEAQPLHVGHKAQRVKQRGDLVARQARQVELLRVAVHDLAVRQGD